MSTSGGDDKGGGALSLEELLASDAKSAPAGSPVAANGTFQNPLEIDLARVDALLDAEDPTFISKIQDLRQNKISELDLAADMSDDTFGDKEIELMERRREGDTPPPPSPEGPGLKGQIKRLTGQFMNQFKRSKDAFSKTAETDSAAALETKTKVSVGEWTKSCARQMFSGAKSAGAASIALLKGARTMSRAQKFGYFGVVALSLLLGLVVSLSMRGRLLPSFEVQFLPTVASRADQAWDIGDDEEWDDFYSPLHHPEYVLLLDKVVVNLVRSESSDENPMGYFEFYLELSSRDAAVEASDRKAEISDAVQRTVEAISYDEIVTPAGKNKLKLVIRKNVNKILTQGRVRKVFYKSVVIKP